MQATDSTGSKQGSTDTMSLSVSFLHRRAVRFREMAGHLLTLLIISLIIYLGFVGVDFGNHWDEYKIVNSVENSIRSGVFLPRWYNYPSMSYDIALIGAILYKIILNIRGVTQSSAFGFLDFLGGNGFLIYTRSVFLVITVGFTSIWIYIAVYMWRCDWLEAFISTTIFASSWELAYHARWIAPDGLVMQFGVLTILCVITSLRARYSRCLTWLSIAALSSGLVAGSKYYGGIFIIPVFLAYFYIQKDTNQDVRKYYFGYLKITALFFLSFIFSSLGALVEPQAFFHDVLYELHHYQSGHGGYTVSPVGQHGYLLFQYISMVMLSDNPVIAIILFLFAIFGCYFLVKDEKIGLLLYAFFPCRLSSLCT